MDGCGINTPLIYLYMLLITFWVKWHTFAHDFYFSPLVCPAWEHLLLCKCWVWTPGLVPLSGTVRPLGAVSPCVRACGLGNGVDSS